MIDGLQQFGLNAHPTSLWPVVAVLTVLGVAALYTALRSFWRLRIMADTPTARIRSAPQGYVELAGRALPHGVLQTAPLTRRDCVWFRFRVEEQRRSGKSSNWVIVDKGESPGPLLMDDGTGRCLVEPAGAEVTCRARDVWYGASRHPSGPPERLLMVFSRRFRYTEERIVEHEPLYCLGHFETPRRGAAERQALAREVLRGWKQDPARMATFDTDGDGTVSVEEWEKARGKAERIAARAERRVQAEPPLPRLGRTGDPRHPFVISTHGEGDLVRRLRLWTGGGTGVFLLVACGLAILLAARFGG